MADFGECQDCGVYGVVEWHQGALLCPPCVRQWALATAARLDPNDQSGDDVGEVEW